MKHMKKIIFIIFAVLNSYFSFSQISNDSLIEYIKLSEKILITSHENFNLTTPKIGERKRLKSTLLKNGKPNKKIIKEKIQLDLKLKEELIEIISRQKKDSIWDGAYCFLPHHTIFIYKEKTRFFIE